MPFDRSLPDSRADRWIRLFLPLMIVSVCAYLTIIVFEPHSIYSMRLAKSGELITHHKDKAALTMMSMETVIETDFQVVRPDMDLAEMVKAISNPAVICSRW